MKINLPQRAFEKDLDTTENLSLLLDAPSHWEQMEPTAAFAAVHHKFKQHSPPPIAYQDLKLSTKCASLPAGLWSIESLTSLDLNSPFTVKLPSSITGLLHLKHLTLR